MGKSCDLNIAMFISVLRVKQAYVQSLSFYPSFCSVVRYIQKTLGLRDDERGSSTLEGFSRRVSKISGSLPFPQEFSPRIYTPLKQETSKKTFS